MRKFVLRVRPKKQKKDLRQERGEDRYVGTANVSGPSNVLVRVSIYITRDA